MKNEAGCAEIQKTLRTQGEPYSPEAKRKIEDFSEAYAAELIWEAARLASREGVQQIGTVHVEEAKRRLLSIDKRNLIKRLSGNLGGILVGIGTAPLLSLWNGSSPAPTPQMLMIGGVLLATGAGLLVFSLVN
jgi:hypothetical protein